MGHNVYIQSLIKEEVDGELKDKIKIEDNVGEGVHIHWSNIRLNLSLDDFKTMCDELNSAAEKLESWE